MEAEPQRTLAEELAAGLAELEELDKLRTQEEKDTIANSGFLQQNISLPELEELLLKSNLPPNSAATTPPQSSSIEEECR